MAKGKKESPTKFPWEVEQEKTAEDKFPWEVEQEKTAEDKFPWEAEDLKKKEQSDSTSSEEPTPSSEGTTTSISSGVESKAEKARNLRSVARKNEDGSVSTVKMATETFDGKNWVSFPTLFPKDPNNQTENPEDWIEITDPRRAYEEAKRRGEVFEFGENKGEAIAFGEGAWKVSEKPKSDTTLPPTSPDANLYSKMQANDERINSIDDYLEKNRNRDLGDPNAQRKRRELERERTALIKSSEKLSSDYIKPFVDNALKGVINEDGTVNEEYIDENMYGFTVPNLDKVRELSEKANEPLFEDRFYPKIQREIIAAIDFNLNVPREKLQAKTEEKFKELSGGKSMDEYFNSAAKESFQKQYKPEIDKLNNKLRASTSEISKEYSSLVEESNKAFTEENLKINAQYKIAVDELQQRAVNADDAEMENLNKELERLNNDYDKAISDLTTSQQSTTNEFMSRANRDLRDAYDDLNAQMKAMGDEFASKYKAPKELMDIYQKASTQAAMELYDNSTEAKKKIIELQEDINPLKNRVVSSMLSGLGGSLQAMGNALGFEAEFAQDMQQYFQPSIDPIKSFKDITMSKLKESGGNLLGSMAPSLAASTIVAATTKNMPMAGRIALTGMAGWSTETLDLVGRAYRSAIERTGSEVMADKAAEETIDSQLLLLPTYGADALPFVGAFKKINNPALRIATGGVVEYAQEMTQEYPQNLAERAITETGRYNRMWDYADAESFEETAANLLPVAMLGMGGAINPEAKTVTIEDAKNYIIDYIDKNGKDKTSLQVLSLFETGAIDEETLDSLGEFIDSIDESNGTEYNKKVSKLKDIQDAAATEEDPVKKKVLNKEAKRLEEEAAEILTGEPTETETKKDEKEELPPEEVKQTTIEEEQVEPEKAEEVTNAQEIETMRIEGEQEQTEEPSVGDMREIDQAETTQEEAPSGKIRGFAEREANVVGRELGDKEKAKILSNPENYYEPQVLKDIKDNMAEMDDDELVSQMTEEGLMSAKDGDGGTAGLAAAELINRRLAEGKGIDDIVEVIAKKGTTAGQFLRQLAEVKGSTPLGIYSYVQRKLDRLGLEIPSDSKQELLGLSKEYIDNVAKWKEALKAVRDNPTEANQLREFEAQMTAAESFKPLNRMILDLTPRNIWDSMGLAVQGNLLTPMSQATNIFANALQLPIRGSVEVIAGIADAVNSFVTNSPRVNIPSIGGYMMGGKEIIPALKKSFDEIVNGQVSDIAKGEIQRGFRPYRGFLQAIGKAPLPIDKRTGKKSGRASAMFEAIFGAAPQVMFAMLRLGDNLFRMPVRARALYEYGQKKGLSGKDLENFIKYPDEKSLARAEERSKEAVFMEDSTISNLAVGFMNNLSRGIDSTIGKVPIIGKTFAGIARLAIKLSVPYVKTPANIVSQTIDLALPVLPTAKSAIYYRVANKALNGNKYSEASQSEKSAYEAAKRKANIEFGKAVTGTMMVGGAAWLVANGLVSEGIDDDTEKERNLKYATFPPNSVNISGIQRAMNGGDPSLQPNDKFVALSKMGLFGMVVGIYARVNKADMKSELKKPEGETKAEEYSRYVEQYLLIPQSIIGFATEQSFLAGINSLLKAVSDGKYEDWFKNTFKAVTSILLPNTLAAINRAQREFLPDLRSNNVFEQLENVILDKTWNTEDLPIRVDYFGRDIRQTPEGRNPWVYQLIDVTKGRVMTDDPVDNEIFNIYKETHDSRVIPNMKKRRVEEDGKYLGDMTPEQYREINKKLGEARYRAVSKLIGRSSYVRADFSKKADLIANEYRKASKDREYSKAYAAVKKEIQRR